MCEHTCRRRLAQAFASLDTINSCDSAGNGVLSHAARLSDDDTALLATLLAGNDDVADDGADNPFDPHTVHPVLVSSEQSISVSAEDDNTDDGCGSAWPPQSAVSMSLSTRMLEDVERDLVELALDHDWRDTASIRSCKSSRVAAVRASVAGTLRSLGHASISSLPSATLASEGSSGPPSNSGAAPLRQQVPSVREGGSVRSDASRHTPHDYLRPMREARELARTCAPQQFLVRMRVHFESWCVLDLQA